MRKASVNRVGYAMIVGAAALGLWAVNDMLTVPVETQPLGVARADIRSVALDIEEPVPPQDEEPATLEVIEIVDTVAPRYSIPLSYELQQYTYDLCVEYGIEEYYPLVLAVMQCESNYTPDVISRSNDYGIMQINACNHAWLMETLGIVDFLDPYQNIEAGVYMLSSLLNKYDDSAKALMAYNRGETGARRKWEAGIYTSDYSDKVLSALAMLEPISEPVYQYE